MVVPSALASGRLTARNRPDGSSTAASGAVESRTSDSTVVSVMFDHGARQTGALRAARVVATSVYLIWSPAYGKWPAASSSMACEAAGTSAVSPRPPWDASDG